MYVCYYINITNTRRNAFIPLILPFSSTFFILLLIHSLVSICLLASLCVYMYVSVFSCVRKKSQTTIYGSQGSHRANKQIIKYFYFYGREIFVSFSLFPDFSLEVRFPPTFLRQKFPWEAGEACVVWVPSSSLFSGGLPMTAHHAAPAEWLWQHPHQELFPAW